MKASKALLTSLLLNLIALGAVPALLMRLPNAGREQPAVSSNPAPEPMQVPVPIQAVTVSAPSWPFQWRNVESENYKQYIVNLRAIGCPEETIKDIIIADVNKLYAPRIAALRVPREYKFWESRQTRGPDPIDRDRQQQRIDLEKEKNNVIKELLGVDPAEEARRLFGIPDNRKQHYDFIPKEKWQDLATLLNRLADMEREIYRKAGDDMDAQTHEELRKLSEQRRVELARILTPEELEEYQLRNSRLANRMRDELAGFEPSEEEFRKIFPLRDEFEVKYGNLDSYPDETPAEADQRAEAQKRLEDQLKTQLGAQRYEDYKLNQDPAYKALIRLGNRHDLPQAIARKVYDMKTAAEAQALSVRRDSGLSEVQRQLALAAIQEETKLAVMETLGEQGFKGYRRSGGYWIDSLGP